MKIMVKSIQIYESHQDQMVEKYADAQLEYRNNQLILQYEKGTMLFDLPKKEVQLITGRNIIEIKNNEKKVLTYETPYGKIKLETIGKSLDVKKEPFRIQFSYQIKLNEGESYTNIVTITEDKVS